VVLQLQGGAASWLQLRIKGSGGASPVRMRSTTGTAGLSAASSAGLLVRFGMSGRLLVACLPRHIISITMLSAVTKCSTPYMV
jgi:hypothetical protein